jgi:hypothetical protein
MQTLKLWLISCCAGNKAIRLRDILPESTINHEKFAIKKYGLQYLRQD